MENNYVENATLFKSMSDSNRLRIVDMLSCGTLCACELLEKLQITQPTLSHHMKILCDGGLVKARREAKWIHYSLNTEQIEKMMQLLTDLVTDQESSSCKDVFLRQII
ncbi:MAG: metalloregulator ArsR/SmtB family transcription factor [Desulfitobacterium hafniense]|nr:metalloregulator ArsR/SmtB family transcription factor [Desulfitobacterium hafniense]